MIIKILYLDQNDVSRIWQPSRPALLKLCRETTKTFPYHQSSMLVASFFGANTKFEPPVFLFIRVCASNLPNVFVLSSGFPIEVAFKLVFPLTRPMAFAAMRAINFGRVMIEHSIAFITVGFSVHGTKSGNCPVACIIPN
jgi:hypothetical protein